MVNYVWKLIGNGRKIREFFPAPPTLSVGLVGSLKPLGAYEEATEPQGRAL
jgi:hypothetical protein